MASSPNMELRTPRAQSFPFPFISSWTNISTTIRRVKTIFDPTLNPLKWNRVTHTREWAQEKSSLLSWGWIPWLKMNWLYYLSAWVRLLECVIYKNLLNTENEIRIWKYVLFLRNLLSVKDEMQIFCKMGIKQSVHMRKESPDDSYPYV